MRPFLWKIACEDYQILLRSTIKSRRIFAWSGVIMCVNYIITTLGLYQFFEIIFTNPLLAIAIGLFVTIVFMNIYRLCLTTLNKDETHLSLNYILSLVGRLLFIGFIGLIGIIGFESFIIFSITKTLDIGNYNGKILLSLFDLHSLFPRIWYVTFLLLVLFVTPFFIKFSIGHKSRYILEKKAIEKQLILDDYKNFKTIYSKLFYENYNLNLVFKESFLDPPFNTKPKKVTIKLGNTDDFLKSLSSEEIN